MKSGCKIIKKVVEYFDNLCYDLFKIKNRELDRDRELTGMKKKLTILDIAHFFSAKESMTNKKLQKLSYYAYAWYIALNNECEDKIQNRLCENTTFEAWVHGPVCRILWNSISTNYGIVDRYDGKINPLITGELEKFLNKIYKTFGKYTGDELEEMTHNEDPWKNARKNLAPSEPSSEPILESDMFVYYNSLYG